jgi:cobalamin biosynthesis protein CbiD
MKASRNYNVGNSIKEQVIEFTKKKELTKWVYTFINNVIAEKAENEIDNFISDESVNEMNIILYGNSGNPFITLTR